MHEAGIVITTRNREQDLKKLFSLFEHQVSWQNYPFLVHDDASDNVSEEYWHLIQEKSIKVIKNSQRLGLILSRNMSNSAAPFKFIFSLDDDSCFVDPDGPKQAVNYLEAHPHVGALAFPLVNSLTPDDSPQGKPYPCQTYIGCAHLLRKDLFVQLGGYRHDFVHQCEEPEFCLRLWKAGYEVHAFPNCRVHHWVSSTARDYRRIGFYGARNRIWSHMLHTPTALLPYELARSIGSYAKYSLKTKLPIVHAKGLIDGFRQGLKSQSDRFPLSLQDYQKITALPLTAK